MHGPAPIRQAQPSDAAEISALIRRCIRETLAQVQDAQHIEQQYKVWDAAHVERLMMWDDRTMLVACVEGVIAGTACLYRDSVRKVFVVPDRHGQRLGQQLVRHIEHLACERGVTALNIQSNLGAAGFYVRLGYAVVGQKTVGSELFMLMRKDLNPGWLDGRSRHFAYYC